MVSVLHLTYSAAGGAGRAARRAAQAAETAGCRSWFAALENADPELGDIAVARAPARPVRAALAERLKTDVQWGHIVKARTSATNTLFSIPYPGVELADAFIAQAADIIHLHWVSWLATPETIRGFLDAGKPVFWTLHDLWPMTGGCHYPAGCEQYRSVCLKCPQLNDPLDIAHAAFAEKRAAYGGHPLLKIVAPSGWMADQARASRILRDCEITVAPNSVETEIFKPAEDREALRAAMGLRPEDLMIIFGSFDNAERRKGASVLREALEIAATTGGLRAALAPRGRLVLASFGRRAELAAGPDVIMLALDEIDDDEKLADAYAAADALAFPSLEDNYPNTILEAMSCGTPTVGFAAGGVAEMIKDGVTGVLCDEIGDPKALAAALRRFAARHHGDVAMREACRARVLAENAMTVVGGRLRALYARALGLPDEPCSAPPAPASHAVRRRARAMFETIALEPAVRATETFYRFPFKAALKQQLQNEIDLADDAAGRELEREMFAARREPPPDANAKMRVAIARTFHAHHSARSGPHQFGRFLDAEEFEADWMSTPLGGGYASPAAKRAASAAAGLGAVAMLVQTNAVELELELLHAALRGSYDLVHFMDGELGGWLAPSAMRAVMDRRDRPALVATFHQPPDILRGLIAPDLLSRFDHVIALSAAQHDFLAQYAPAERMSLIPHGVDTDFFRPPEAERPGLSGSNQGFRLLAVGHWLRDYDAAFAAMRRLAEEAPDLTLDVVCPAELNHKLPDNVTLRSGLSDEELRALYQEADALFMPLKDATANNAILEAMACGLPVISTDVGGVAEAVGPAAAVMAPPGDVDALCAALRDLRGDPMRRRAMGRAARARALELSWPRIAELHAALYRRAIAANRAKGER